jgi:hypothetical protein
MTPTVSDDGRSASLSIPFDGDASGARVYRLVKPAGWAALLPQARTDHVPGKFDVNANGLRQVWIQNRPNGLHLRVIFGPAAVEPEATLEGNRWTVSFGLFRPEE